MSNAKFVKLSAEQIKKQNKEHYLYNKILIYIKDDLAENININNVIATIEHTIPYDLTNGIDEIFIGYFEEFSKRDINSVFFDGAIYVTNNQTSEESLTQDIIHEIAHSVEENFGLEIYSDDYIEREFLNKRQKLYWILKDYFDKQGINISLKLADFSNLDYSFEFDKLLYKDIGYKALTSLTAGLYASPYAATSIREYFADGFEDYFVNNNRNNLKKISPELHNKLDNLFLMVNTNVGGK